MGMASRALSLLLPSWFRRRPNAPSPDPEEARWTETRRPLEDPYKRLIAELRPPRGPRSPAPPDSSEALTYETEKRQWIDEQKRLIAEAMRRAGGPHPRWNDGDKDDRREVKGRRTAVIEELSAFEIKKRRWMAEHKRSIARARLRSRFEAALRERQVHPVVSTTETASDPAKRPSVDDEKSGGGVDRDSDRWLAERDEARKRRQRYLRNYCPFQIEEEIVPEEEEEIVPEEEEERERIEPDDDAEIERSVHVLPVDGPAAGSVDGEFVMKSAIEKNPWGGRRHSEEYYARRREVLHSFKFVTDESEKASVGAAPRSACATKEEPDDAEIERTEEEPEEERKPEEPNDAEIERTVPVNGPESDDAEFLKLKPVTEENPRGRCRRGDEGYYAMRREVLQSFKFGKDESEEAGVDAARRSACATRRRNVMSVLGFARVPAAAKTCCTG